MSRLKELTKIPQSSWPELLGAQARVAIASIEAQNPYVDTQVVLEGTIVTGEFSCTRVRVWIDRNRTVTRVPIIGKSSWPELLGAQARVAIATIETENPYVDTQVVLEGTVVTGEFSCTRVRVWIDRNRTVTRVPIIG
ncbi:hypothetical protein NC652_017421 [Populus alba x Populus x berolinensis]|uniref:Uncharacterized protein n=1 Tax=Populus tomentosa TaxID=118781 RepID=A0A8X7ZR16_POPTO|nr:hypothetical protein POTOM_023878 [Populus tomentosa]KAJ6924110.1 hypothetical protein NC652_017421 [Populus alba x Populus x berolinensis]